MRYTQQSPSINEMRQILTDDLDAFDHYVQAILDSVRSEIDKLRKNLSMLKRKQQLLETRTRLETLMDLVDTWPQTVIQQLSGEFPCLEIEKGRSLVDMNHQNGEDDGLTIELGQFATEREAALAYDRAAILIYGDEADTNFAPEESEHVTFSPEIMRQIAAAKRGQRLH